MKIHVCDAVMGSGKTQAAITMMNRDSFFLNPLRDREDGSAHVVLELFRPKE